MSTALVAEPRGAWTVWLGPGACPDTGRRLWAARFKTIQRITPRAYLWLLKHDPNLQELARRFLPGHVLGGKGLHVNALCGLANGRTFNEVAQEVIDATAPTRSIPFKDHA